MKADRSQTIGHKQTKNKANVVAKPTQADRQADKADTTGHNRTQAGTQVEDNGTANKVFSLFWIFRAKTLSSCPFVLLCVCLCLLMSVCVRLSAFLSLIFRVCLVCCDKCFASCPLMFSLSTCLPSVCIPVCLCPLMSAFCWLIISGQGFFFVPDFSSSVRHFRAVHACQECSSWQRKQHLLWTDDMIEPEPWMLVNGE